MLYLLYFLSGAAGLVYQIVWSRFLNDLFGVTAYAVTAVVATFLAGLALGALVVGRLADRQRDPRYLYGWLEIGIGLTALAGLAAVRAIEPLHLWAANHFAPDSIALILVRVGLGAVAMLPATFLMGGTLPVMTRAMVRRLGQLGRELSLLYALNTLGAVVGCLAAGFVLIRALGLHGTLWVAVALNLAVGMAALALAARRPERACPPTDPESPEDELPAAIPAGRSGLLAVMALSGFASMGLEVYWTRLLMLIIGTASYAFTTMLASILVGITLGSFLVRRFVDRLRDPRRVFGWIQVGIAGSSLATLPLLGSRMTQEWVAGRGDDWLGLIAARFGVSFSIMLVPTTLIGMTFPLAGRIWTRRLDSLGTELGQVYGANTLGNILGAAIGGFVLLPAVGLQRGIALLCLFSLASAAWGLLPAPGVRSSRVAWSNAALPLGAIVLCAVLLVRWQPTPLSAWGETPQDQLRFYEEDVAATVKVLQNTDDPRLLWMAVDGIRVGQSMGGVDAKQQALAHFPFLLMADQPPADVLTIGLGTGVLAGEVLRYPGVRKVDCLEISQGVIEGARLFDGYNERVLYNPRAHVIHDDGVNFLKRTSESYDAIVSDAKSRSTHAGNGLFFSEDYYRLCFEHLREHGLMIQWTPSDIPPVELRTVLRTFFRVFPHAYVWLAPPPSCLIVGTKRPLAIDIEHVERLLAAPAAARLRQYGWVDAEDVASLLSADRDSLAEWLAGERTINSVEHPVIEFYSPRIFTVAPDLRRAENLSALAAARESTLANFPALRGARPGFETRYRAVGDWILGLALLQRSDPRVVPQAVALLDGALEASPGMGQLHYTLPQAYEIAAQLAPGAGGPLAAQGRLLMYQGRLEAAEERLRRALAIDPADVAARTTLGMLLGSVGKFEPALAELERALELEPDFAPARSTLGVTLHLAGQPEAALAHLRRALEERPDDVAALNALAGILVARDPHEAIRLAERAARLTGYRQPSVLDTLARAYAAAGDVDRARATELRIAAVRGS